MADADDAIEPKTEGQRRRILMLNSVYSFVCCKMCTRKKQTKYLPQEMVFHILSHVPAQVLHDVMRYVCREWNLMIRSRNFIRRHLRNSTGGILIQERISARYAIYVEMRRGCLEICKLDRGFDNVAWTSCNGLLLAPDSGGRRNLYVTNPLTKQLAVVPAPFLQRGFNSDFCLAFVEASMEYKAVHAYTCVQLWSMPRIAVLTIGVDKVWRRIDIKHLFLSYESTHIDSPLVTRGYVHWVGENFVLTLNVETETVRRFPKPQLPEVRFLVMGSNLSFVSEFHESLTDVWEMDPETGEWSLLLSFDLEAVRYRFMDVFCKYAKTLIPLGWLADGEVLLFRTLRFERYCLAYNVKTGENQSFKLDPTIDWYHFQAHVNSLVWLEGGF